MTALIAIWLSGYACMIAYEVRKYPPNVWLFDLVFAVIAAAWPVALAIGIVRALANMAADAKRRQ